jgi:hypothetical protein
VTRLAALLLLTALLAAPGAAGQVEAGAKPKLAVFVAGIEKYTRQASLNNLKSVARDARAVFDQLRAISDTDEESNRLLLASASAPVTDPNPLDHVLEQQEWKAEDVEDEILRFVRKAPRGRTIVIYFGGHGIVAGGHLLLTGSDYSDLGSGERDGFIRFANLYSGIDQILREQNRPQEKVVILINSCHAGAGAGVADAGDDYAEQVADVVKALENTQGLLRYALIPASAQNEEAFERAPGGRSEFAYYLLQGLRRPGKDGVITTGELFSFVNGKLNSKLPRNPGFAGDIELGRTSELDAAAHHLLALSHASVWLEFDDPAHRDLALAHLGKAFESAGDGSPASHLIRLRAAQILAAGGRPAEEWRDDLQAVLADTEQGGLPEGERAAALELLAATKPPSSEFPTLSKLRAYLEQGKPFYALVAGQVSSSYGAQQSRASSSAVQGRARIWRSLLESYAGKRAPVEVLDLRPSPLPPTLADQARPILQSWAVEAGSAPLLLVYDGLAGLTSDGRPFPLGPNELAGIMADWTGPIVLVYAGPFGGYLLEGPLPLRVTVLTAGIERTAMTFRYTGLEVPDLPPEREAIRAFLNDEATSRLGGTTRVMALGLLEGGDDPAGWPWLQAYRSLHEQNLASQSPGQDPPELAQAWVVGTPGWRVGRGTASDPVQLARSRLAPLRSLGLLLAKGCAQGDLVICERSLADLAPAAPSEATAVPLLEGLAAAAAADLRRDAGGARAGYDAFLKLSATLRAVSAPADAPDPIDAALAAAASVLQGRATEVENLRARLEAGSGGSGRVRYVPVAIEDYASPLVPDLPGGSDDAEHWGIIIEKLLGSIDRRPLPSPPRTAAELEAHLAKVLAEADEDDLTVLYVSARGYTDTSGYGIAMPGWDPRTRDQAAIREQLQIGMQAPNEMRVASSDYGLGKSSLLIPDHGVHAVSSLLDHARDSMMPLRRVADLAQEGKGWFLGLYDTQFEPPVFDSSRPDAILDKHVDATRPLDPRTASPPQRTVTVVPVTSGDQYRQQLHVWLEGTLTQGSFPSSSCFGARDPAWEPFHSPLSVTLTQAFRPGMTYRELLEGTVHCLGQLETAGTPVARTLVAQGDLDLPLFGSGPGLERLVMFKGEYVRRDLNLRPALALAEDALRQGDDRLVQLSAATFRVVLAERQPELPVSLRAPEFHGWLVDAIGILAKLETSGFESFPDVRLDLETRALELQGGTERARERLATGLPQLDSPQPAMVERLVRLTSAALQREGGPLLRVLDRVLDQVCELGGSSPRLEQCAKWQDLLARERAVWRERYLVVPEGFPD